MSVLMLFAADLAVMAVFTDSRTVLVVCIVAAGALLGVNNTLVTQAVMLAAPVDRGTASAAYSFVRFVGGAIAPWLAGRLGETMGPHVPFWMGAGATVLGVAVLATGRRVLAHVDAGVITPHGVREATVLTAADA
jgi:predicted MFS family arabinose efflux permease